MILEFCAVCGTTNELQQHHIEPVVLTGIKRHRNKRYVASTKLKNATAFDCFARLFDLGVVSDDESLTVCSYHHNILHGIMKFQKIEHSKLISEGIKKARERGVIIGRPTNVDEDTPDKVRQLIEAGYSMNRISEALKIGSGTLYKLKEQYDI